MNTQNLYYQESGNVHIVRLTMAYAIFIALAMVLGYIYTLLSIFIPFVYLNFFITTGFGVVLGMLCRVLIRVSHARNKQSRVMLAVIVGLLANYFQWTAYISYAYNGEIPSVTEYLSNLSWIVMPKNFLAAIGEIYQYGTWSMFGATVKGLPLAIIWILEAVIIVGSPVLAILKTEVYPYSEVLLRWYPKYTLFNDFESIAAAGILTGQLREDPVKALEALGLGTGHRHAKVHLYYLKEEANQYLTFENVYIERGKDTKNREVVINNFAIDGATAERILETFQHKHERVDVV